MRRPPYTVQSKTSVRYPEDKLRQEIPRRDKEGTYPQKPTKPTVRPIPYSSPSISTQNTAPVYLCRVLVIRAPTLRLNSLYVAEAFSFVDCVFEGEDKGVYAIAGVVLGIKV